VVNPLLGPNADSYLAAPGSQMLLGARYALVRPFIRRLRPMRAQEPPTPFRALIAMGDDDVRGQARPHYPAPDGTNKVPAEMLRGLLEWSHAPTLAERWAGVRRLIRGWWRQN